MKYLIKRSGEYAADFVYNPVLKAWIVTWTNKEDDAGRFNEYWASFFVDVLTPRYDYNCELVEVE